MPISTLLLALALQPLPAKPVETLVWSDEFNQAKTAPVQPDPAIWSYVTGPGEAGGVQTYCTYASAEPPCDPAQPNSFVGPDGYLHITVQKNASGSYTSAFLQTKKLKSFQYGRIEARIQLPATQGMWPAFWMLGDRISQISWPNCGELDIMEYLGRTPNRVYGTIHAQGYAQPGHGKTWDLPGKQPLAAAFHTFGMIWRPRLVQFYVDDPAKPYATFTPESLGPGEDWPFDSDHFYLILNTALGGDWSGPPDSTTKTPADMLVDYVRVYQSPS